ncbi:MAG: hypothetical protein JOS17DRAFT_803305 [Linnemannia elongata]|nr:MAG: hypothetical protein JOS17DRAFT_803305 [Linnemannia elongata]
MSEVLDKVFIYGVAVIIPLTIILVMFHLCGWWRFVRIGKPRKSTAAGATTTTTTTTTTTFTSGDGDAPYYFDLASDNNGYDNAVLPPYSTAIAMDTLRTPPPPLPPIASDHVIPAATPANNSRP